MVEESTAAAMKRLSDEMFKGRAEQTAALEKRAKQEVLTANQFKALIKQNEEAAKAAENGDKELIAISEKTQKALDDANKSKKDQKDAANSLKLQREQLELAKKASGFSEKRFRKVEIANAALERQNQILEESEKALKGLGIDSKNNKKHRKQQVKAAKMELSLAKTSGSADAEDEAKKKIRDARGNSYLGKIANGITDIKNSAKDKVVSGAKGLFSMFKKFAFGAFLLATIAFLNSPYFDKMIKAFKEDIIPALTILIDDYIVPFGKFLFGLISGENETIKSIKEFTKGTMFEGVTDGLFKVLGGLVAALSLAVLFKPFFAAKLLVGGAWKLTKLFAGFGKMAATLLGFGKATDAAAKGAAVAAKTAGVATTATKGAGAAASAVKPGLNMPKATGPAKPTKLSSITNAVKDKFTHLKKFPGLLKVANKIPFIGTALSGALLVNTLMDDTKSAKQKVQAVGAVFGGLLGGLGGAKLGALAGVLGGGPIGALVGGLGGGLGGYFAGDYIGGKLADYLMTGEQPKTGAAGDMDAMMEQGAGADIPKAKEKFGGKRSIKSANARVDRMRAQKSGEPTLSYTPNPNKDASRISPDPFAKLQQSPPPVIVNAPTNVNAPTSNNVSSVANSLINTDRVTDKLTAVG
tara:strand:- start:3446 stop:5365 length:1920 start_codon:yes stop_codon:yes gene_type:complete